MALNGICKANSNIFKITLCSTLYHFKNVHKSSIQKTEVDVIDEFTTELIKKKVNKWQTFRENRKLIDNKILTSVLNKYINSNTTKIDIDIRQYDKKTMGNLIVEYLEDNDYEHAIIIMQQCVEYDICPSIEVLQKVLSFCAQAGDRDSIKILQNLLKKSDPQLYEANAELLHYIAEATWIRGNVTESLKLFEEVYKNYVFLRRKIRLIIKYLVSNITTERSEATLVLLENFAENLAKEYKDFYLLTYIWQICFLSDWYADQSRATKILERHKKLINVIALRVPAIVHAALRKHKPDAVHRLLEILLKYEVKSSYAYILQSLFLYRYMQNDVRSCAEILEWALKINTPLPPALKKQFVTLLAGGMHSVQKRPSVTDFELKF